MRVAAALALAVSFEARALAHGGAHVPAGPSGWDLAALALLTISGALYLAGSRRLSARGAHVRPIERTAFWTGWAALVAAVAPPLDAAAAERFSAHMAQHELLILIGAPLVIVGRPIVPWLWALPTRMRPAAGAALQQHPVSRAWRVLTTPVVAWALHGATIWIWHAPAFYEAAVRHEGIHAFQHATFVGTAVLFWWGLVYGRYGRAAYGASVLFVFTTMIHTGLLGALFVLSGTPFYGLYQERAAAAGIDPVVDQQLAGLYMWVPAGVILTLFALALLLAWIADSERRGAKEPVRHALWLLLAAGAALTASAACDRIPHEREARLLTGGDPYRGRDQIRRYGCDSCHTIPGVRTADALVGPPLTGIALRTYLAGRLENTPENMQRWIRHPWAVDARTAMPDMGVTERDARDIAAYLYTLR